jgi:hypothetical protein
VLERHERVHGLVGKGRLSVDSPEADGTLQLAVEVQEPASLYLETADLLGNPRGLVATDGSSFTFYRPDEDLFYVGSATAANVGRFLPIRAEPAELARMLLGELAIVDPEELRLELDDSTGTYVLWLRAGAIRQRLVVGTRDLRLISVETRGARAVDALLEEHEELLPGLPFPKSIQLTLRQRDTVVRIRYGELALNPESAPETFLVRPPEGARIETLP